jgi:hypothetical protein
VWLSVLQGPHYGKQASPTCGHRYSKMSTGHQPDGAYQVTATSHWVVEWTGGGQSGTTDLDLTTDPRRSVGPHGPDRDDPYC